MIPTPTSSPVDIKNDLSFHWQVQLSSQLINYFLKDFLKALVEEGLWFLILIQFRCCSFSSHVN